VAIITKMPSMTVVNGFKGTLDFYWWMGIACVRKWPRSPGHDRSQAVRAGWPAFAWASSNWNSLSPAIQQAYNTLAQGTYMTGRDIFTKSFINGDTLYMEGI